MTKAAARLANTDNQITTIDFSLASRWINFAQVKVCKLTKKVLNALPNISARLISLLQHGLQCLRIVIIWAVSISRQPPICILRQRNFFSAFYKSKVILPLIPPNI